MVIVSKFRSSVMVLGFGSNKSYSDQFFHAKLQDHLILPTSWLHIHTIKLWIDKWLIIFTIMSPPTTGGLVVFEFHGFTKIEG